MKEDPNEKIIVVNQKKDEQKVEPELETLNNIEKVQPLLSTMDNVNWNNIFLTRKNNQTIPETLNPQSFIKFFERYQNYIMKCSQTVIKDQNLLSENFKQLLIYCNDIDGNVSQRLTQTKQVGDQLIGNELISKVESNIEKTQILISDIISKIDKLDEVIPDELKIKNNPDKYSRIHKLKETHNLL
ncbi:hypothetical protein H8356DRAFT_1695325 [Neocallimastix lanati (nom. inval.)]|jgi:hypothetical protein|uniref:BLOC-1-related complex subunit 5 n=1 Tax=Neocallimastix californiae TaxID=1754190 RepID=A0A1Y2AK37_9FUNG|nr:hypothetical protein H8356DRAFT_1695325 [Neocallimastix sp. JGI-2020a]ORY22929.1 hypothetical protein LY90DRAFT_675663 [Neocallimastix californiae]|eukprot:ORY22929.1 hypothetical protein LY90DRAFT_675663 [Neocallimastix californiae]